MVVQEFLQRRREPWRWAWCLAIPSWQLPTESHHCKLTVTNWDPSLKVIFLQLHKKLLKNSMSIILRLSGIWSKLERWKSFRVWHELTANQKNRCLEVLSSLFCATTTNHFLIRLQLLMTSSVVGPRRSSKALPKPNLHQKKRSWSLFGSLLLVWPTTAFWILAKPIYVRNMLSKLMRCTENRNSCSRHWSKKRPDSSPQQCLTTSHNQCFKSWMNWATKFCYICCIYLISQPTTTSSSI